MKRAMVRAGQRVVVLAGSSELDQETLVRFAAPEDVVVRIPIDRDTESLNVSVAAGIALYAAAAARR